MAATAWTPEPQRLPIQVGRHEAKARGRERLHIAIMLAPATLVLVVVFGGAVVYAFLQSLGYAPLYGINEFPTTRHFEKLLASSDFWWSLFYTFYYAIVPTAVGLVLSLCLAFSLRRQLGRLAFMRHLFKLPLMIPYLVGVALTILLFANGGIAARALYALGLIRSTGEFPRLLQTHGGWGIMMVYLWKQVPFTTLVLSSVLVGLGKELEEAAATLGASRAQATWHVMLPQVMPGIVSATIIVFAFNFGSFETPFVLGPGHPETLPVAAFRSFTSPDYAQRLDAMAIVTVVAVISAILLWTYIALYRRFERRRGRQ